MTQLKLAVGDWLARADLDGIIPQLIKLGEAKLFRKFDGVTALSSSNTTNFVLTNHPDLYLYASLSEAAPYLGQDERLTVWKNLYSAEIGKVRKPKDGVLLTTYDGLKAAIADWLERYDIDSVIPRFIELAEVRLNQDVRHYHMENRANRRLRQSISAKTVRLDRNYTLSLNRERNTEPAIPFSRVNGR